MNTLFDSFYDELEKIANAEEAKRLADHRRRRGKKTRGAPSRSLKQMFPDVPSGYDSPKLREPGGIPRDPNLERSFMRGREAMRRATRPGLHIDLRDAYLDNVDLRDQVGRHIRRLKQSGGSPEILKKYEELFQRKRGKIKGVDDADHARVISETILEQRKPGRTLKTLRDWPFRGQERSIEDLTRQIKRLI